MTGCETRPPSWNSAAADPFTQARPASLRLDPQLLYRAAPTTGDYRVIPGDLLELQMPTALQVATADLAAEPHIERVHPILCRVRDDGTILLPIAGPVPVAGHTLAEIEQAVQQAYWPRFVVSPPPVVSRVAEHKTFAVTVTGAVKEPGTYRLRNDRMTLVALLMAAGGIIGDGAAGIRLTRTEATASDPNHVGPPTTVCQTHVLPVTGMNVPFADVPLQEGDTVEVVPLLDHVFTVIGLVRKPGTYPYPPGAEYNLPQALAFAGGVDPIAEPRYVRIYRPLADGRVIDAVFDIQPGPGMQQAMRVLVQPGDVVAVEQTPRTRMNLALSDILSIRTSVGLQFRR